MNKPFTFEEREFDIRVTQPGHDMYCVQTFMNNEPANHRELCITYTNSDAFKALYGYPGIEQLMRDEQLYIEQGNYFGSPYYAFSNKRNVLTTPSGVKAVFERISALVVKFDLTLPDGTTDSFAWSTTSEKVTNPGLGGPLVKHRNEVLNAFWAWELNS